MYAIGRVCVIHTQGIVVLGRQKCVDILNADDAMEEENMAGKVLLRASFSYEP